MRRKSLLESQKMVLSRYLEMLVLLSVFVTLSAVAQNALSPDSHRIQNMPDYQYVKCGLPQLVGALASGDTKRFIELTSSRRRFAAKDTEIHVSPSGHFQIHYLPALIPQYDRDNNSVPDYLEFVATSFDRAWEIEIDSLGFQPPLDINGVERTTYDVFCESLGSGLYGRTTWTLGNDIASLPGFNYPTDIDINISFSFVNYPDITSDPIVRDSLAIAVTAAHEFNHALQLSYRVWQEGNNINGNFLDLWFFESSATYMEEIVAGEVNDYLQYLDNWFISHQSNITVDTGLRIYGQAIFFLMLQESFGKTISREIWEAVLQRRPLQAVGTVLNNNGSSFVNEWRRLAVWMYYTGNRSISGSFFPEAAFYPEINLVDTDAYNGGDPQQIANDELPPLAFEYYRTPLAVMSGTSLALIPGSNDGDWKGAYFTGSGTRVRDFPAQLPLGIRDLADPDIIDYVVVSGAWGDPASNNGAFYEVRFSESPVTAAPNIVRPGDVATSIRFLNIPDKADIHIFNSNGQRIATIAVEDGIIPTWGFA